MPRFSLSTSSPNALDDDAVRELLAQQERWLVERKSQVEIADLAKEVASFANTDAGWVLIGVHDQDSAKGPRFERVMPKLLEAPQHWLGQKLPKWLDPLPAFDAVTWRVDGNEIVVIRVWRSERAPIVHSGQGVIYERGPDGALPIKSHDRVRELMARRDQAVADALDRLNNPRALPALFARLQAPPPDPTTRGTLAFVVRLTPLGLVQEAFEPVALSAAVFDDAPRHATELLLRLGCSDYANWSDTVHGCRPTARMFQRGFYASQTVELNFGQGPMRWRATYAADAGGVLGVRLVRPRMAKEITANELCEEWLLPAVKLLAENLSAGYAPGRVRFDLWATGLRDLTVRWPAGRPASEHRSDAGTFGENGARSWVQAGHESDLPAGSEDLEEVAWTWTRDLAREAGITVHERAAPPEQVERQLPDGQYSTGLDNSGRCLGLQRE